nr:MAG TPA: hypothetical protein [Caudoviricetes sp.]
MIIYKFVFCCRVNKSLVDPIPQQPIYAFSFYSVSTCYIKIKRPFYF